MNWEKIVGIYKKYKKMKENLCKINEKQSLWIIQSSLLRNFFEFLTFLGISSNVKKNY